MKIMMMPGYVHIKYRNIIMLIHLIYANKPFLLVKYFTPTCLYYIVQGEYYDDEYYKCTLHFYMELTNYVICIFYILVVDVNYVCTFCISLWIRYE